MTDRLGRLGRPVSPPERLFDIHVHIWGAEETDEEFLSFASEWKMRFAPSCLGPDGTMLIDPSVDECIRANDLVLKFRDRRPDLVYGFCYVNPLHGKQAVDEVTRCIAEHKMVGVKLWIACKCSDPKVYPIVEEATRLGVPVLQHSWNRIGGNFEGESYPKDVAILAEKYPQARIIMAHMGLWWREGVDAVKAHPNVFVDTSGFDPETGSIEYAIKELGVDRIMFGSDGPGRDVLCQIGKVASAKLSDVEREKLFYLNAEKIVVPAPLKDGSEQTR